MFNEIPPLPLKENMESIPVLKQLASAHRYLALLHGKCPIIPNESILINTLVLQEAKESSAIENIITTHDALYKAQLTETIPMDPSTKEVSRYAKALQIGFYFVRKQQIISNTTILKIQEHLEKNTAGYRRNSGTVLKNDRTGEVVYTPPQHYLEIEKLMDNLVQFMNDNSMSDLDPLIKMAVIHHRFETIHPFYDGNGRTGRIINILYLIKEKLLDLPILYLSRYIIIYKADYYHLLQQVRKDNHWEPWILFILKGVEETAKETITLIDAIKNLMMDYKHRIREKLPKIYSQDLINHLFKHPYTKIDFLEKELMINRKTAASYLNKLTEAGLLSKMKFGKTNYYVNQPLFNLLEQGYFAKQETDSIRTVQEG